MNCPLIKYPSLRRVLLLVPVFLACCALSMIAQAVNPHTTTVYPTGSFPLDVQNVQAAIDGGGTVILKATNTSGQPMAFNFGPADVHNDTRANLTSNVTILGERVGQSMTTINGGFAPFLGFAPVRTHIEGIDFEGPMDTPIAIVRSTGAEIVGNVIRGLVPAPLIFPFQGGETEGIFLAGNDDPDNAITGRVRIANNLIEMSSSDFANGMQLDEVAADIEITGNTVHFLQTSGVILNTGILVIRSHGQANIVNNTVTMGPGAADVFPIGIFVGGHAEARYVISGNSVITDNPSADGMDALGTFSPTHAAVITNNHIVMHSLIPTSGGVALFGAVDSSIVSSNTIEGTNGNAIQILGLDSTTVADSNHAVGNDISRDSPLVSDVFFGPFSTNNVFAGHCATYIDLGVGNQITCGTSIESPYAVQTAAERTRRSKMLARDHVRGARLNGLHSHVGEAIAARVTLGRSLQAATRSSQFKEVQPDSWLSH